MLVVQSAVRNAALRRILQLRASCSSWCNRHAQLARCSSKLVRGAATSVQEVSKEQQILAKKSMWRQKHESFIRNIRQAREVQQVIAKGGKLSDLPPPPPDENPDYIACPHCSRRFAPKVAERHIPKCETIKSKPRPPPQRRR